MVAYFVFGLNPRLTYCLLERIRPSDAIIYHFCSYNFVVIFTVWAISSIFFRSRRGWLTIIQHKI